MYLSQDIKLTRCNAAHHLCLRMQQPGSISSHLFYKGGAEGNLEGVREEVEWHGEEKRDKKRGKAVKKWQKHTRRLQTFSSWRLQQEADTHHVCRPSWGGPWGLHKAGSLRQLLGHTRHILHKHMLAGFARPSTMSYKSPKTTECTLTGISMQKSMKQICWHQCLFTDDKVRQ